MTLFSLTLIALPFTLSVFMQKSTPMVGIPADVNTPSVYLLTMLVLPTPASPEGEGKEERRKEERKER